MLATLRNTTFRSLRHRNYRRYFAGQIVSFVGTWMQSAALMWLMYDRTSDPRWPSWLLVAQVGPTLFFGAWGGTLADRHPKRTLVFVTQTAFLLNAVALTLFVGAGLATPLLVLALIATNGVIQAVDFPTRLAFVPDLVPKEDLINAVGLNSLVFNSARAVGPALAGLLFVVAGKFVPYLPAGANGVTVGATACFALNALSFLAVLRALRRIPEPRRNEKPAASPLAGVRYLWAHPALGAVVLFTFALSAFGWPIITVLPAYTRLQLGLKEEAYSFLLSSLGAGALGAALVTATFGSVARRGAFLVVGVSTCAAGLAELGFAQAIWLACGGCGAIGFGMILFLSTAQSTLQLAVPDEVRGRVMAVWAMTLSGSAPVGHLLAGHMITVVGVGPVLFGMAAGVGAVLLFLVGLLALRAAPQKPHADEHTKSAASGADGARTGASGSPS